MLYTVTRCLSLHLGERARAQSRIFDYTLATSAGPVAGFALAFIAVALVAPTPEAALLGYGVAQAVVLAWLIVRQNMRLVLRMPDRTLLRQALGFGLPLIVAGVAAWFGTNAIRILVDHRLGPEAMGLIAVGWALGQRITSMTAMFVTAAAFPIAVERFRVGSRDEAYHEITTNGLLMFGIALPSAVGLYLLQEPLVSLFVAAPFRAMTIAVLPAGLIAGLCRNIRTHVADQVFVLIERTTMVSIMTIAEGLAVVVGCWIGLLAAGPVGAAYGSAAGYALTMVAGFAVAHLRAGLRLPAVRGGSRRGGSGDHGRRHPMAAPRRCAGRGRRHAHRTGHRHRRNRVRGGAPRIFPGRHARRVDALATTRDTLILPSRWTTALNLLEVGDDGMALGRGAAVAPDDDGFCTGRLGSLQPRLGVLEDEARGGVLTESPPRRDESTPDSACHRSRPRPSR